MSEQIDWSKAPEGATHRGAINWFKSDGEKVYTFDGAVWHPASWEIWQLAPFAKRPSIHADEWSGEGLPPVGVVCRKCYNSPDEYYNVKILAHDDHCGDVAIYRWIEGPLDGELDQSTMHLNMASGSNAHWSFRPIRTPEQIAADEREAAIKEMTAGYSKDSGTLAGWAAYVYDTLGYRKP